MSSLHTGDIHMTENPRDVHRWGLWRWLRDQVVSHSIMNVVLYGDLTDAKDRHPASLVDKMVEGVSEVAEHADVWIIKANHDYRDPRYPFFKFLGELRRVRFFSEPADDSLNVAGKPARCLFLPNTASPETDWARFKERWNDFSYIFCHQSFCNARRENGTVSKEGCPVSIFSGFKGQVYSGDVHVPQRFGTPYGPEYIGAPYRVDFGDRFSPRVLYLDGQGRKHNLRYPCPNKHVVEVNADGETVTPEGIEPGDQVKVRARLRRQDFHLWPEIRASVRSWAQAGGWQLFGPELHVAADPEGQERPARAPGAEQATPADRLRAFGEVKGVSTDVLDLGVSILEAS